MRRHGISLRWLPMGLLSLALSLITLSSYAHDFWIPSPKQKHRFSDTIRFADAEIDSFVAVFLAPKNTKRNGKQKANKQFSADFEGIISELEKSPFIFTFVADHPSVQMDAHTLGTFQAEKEAGRYIIAVPDHQSGAKANLMNRFGGRGALLAEETYHAYQLAIGDLIPKEEGFEAKSGTFLGIEVDAKIFAANSGMAKMRTKNASSNFSVPTLANLIKQQKGDRVKVLQIINRGVDTTIPRKDGRSVNLKDRPSY